MSKPARRQVAKSLGTQGPGAGKEGQAYNIYYDRWAGSGKRKEYNNQDKAEHRCDPVKDSGTTKGTHNPSAYFCAFFAKGCCPNGPECNWLHRIPTIHDHVDSGIDVFGRERFNDHRDDLGGIGSMRSDSKTLYVGRIHQTNDMQAIVEKHFAPWGEIEGVKILRDKGVAFVTYQTRLNAEFAKVAMTGQPLDHGEITNIRWATEDPNPKIQAINKRKAIEMTRHAIESKLSEDYKQAEYLPGSEETNEYWSEKRHKQSDETGHDQNTGAQEPWPAYYVGQDGQYYYDYGEYGYSHETGQYDPARLGGYEAYPHGGEYYQEPTTEDLSIDESIKASLLSITSTTTSTTKPSPKAKPQTKTSPSTSNLEDADKPPAKTATSALGALAAYGSDSEDDE
ncbi:Pre-mRNA-splicing factor [Entomortierella beljakovae]|nr:Pre-mRNA-splicing factor [Entomortierella beljakovae]